MSRQAVVVDIHEYYRTGGIDWPRAADNFDALILRAAVGFRLDELYFEHMEKAELHFERVATYAVPDPQYPPDELADFYYEIEGVSAHPIIGDIEPTGGAMVTEYQARKFFERLSSRGGPFAPWYYSNYNYTEALGFPQWVAPMVKFWAEYPYDIYTKYRKVDRYLSKNPWKIPKWAVRSGYTPELHQFSNYGDAQFYLANAKTEDPKWQSGIKSCDLSVSLIDTDEFFALFEPAETVLSLEQRVRLLEGQIKVLSGFHGLN